MKKNEADKTFYIAGIGASAGGLEALRLFVKAIPENPGIAYIVLQHMAPDKKSMMPELLARETELKVESIKDNILPQKNVIYVNPAKYDVIIVEGRLRLVNPVNSIGPKPSVDRFFNSLGQKYKDKAVAIVLSGTGSDGSSGIKTVKAEGGITIAQKPSTAAYDSMPNAAIRAGGADLVLPPEEAGRELRQIIEKFRSRENEIPLEKPEEDFDEIIRLISGFTGINFEYYKEATLKRQIARRMATLHLESLHDYFNLIKNDTAEIADLTNSFLISVTGFFRDTDVFEIFNARLGELIKSKKDNSEFRVWIPACSTGEEVYSTAILILEHLEKLKKNLRVQIFATDVNQKVLNLARSGSYPENDLSEMNEDLVEKYFYYQNGSYKVNKDLKDLVLFAHHDIINNPPFLKLDLICCRNLLIYFKSELQSKIINIFHYSLKEGGMLFLGKSESIGRTGSGFFEVQRRSKIYKKRVTGIEERPVTSSGIKRTENLEPPSLHSKKKEEKTEKSPDDHLYYRNAYNILSENYIPPSLLITDSGEVVEFFGDCSPFLKLPVGKADFNLFNLLDKRVSAEIRALLHRAVRTRKKTVSGLMSLQEKKQNRRYRIVIFPGGSEKLNRDFYIVSFEEVQISRPESGKSADLNKEAKIQISELEDELNYNRESLQTVIEEFETANEELQALNEEAQASNEELQASNEELETANEELQASNEELITVNDELNNRTKELSRLYLEMRSVLNSLDMGILVTDRNLDITRVNNKAFEFFELAAESGENLLSVNPKLKTDNLAETCRNTIESGIFSNLSGEDTEGRKYLFRFYPFKENSMGVETTVGLAIIIEDITDKERAIQEIEKARDAAEKANLAKSTFLANMSHEIRTPLSGMIGFSELLMSEQLPADAYRQAEQIHHSARSLLNILNEILDHSKIESGYLALDKHRFKLYDAVYEACELFTPILKEKDIDFSVDFSEKNPEFVSGDSKRLIQVLTNLLSNALKFTEKGEIRVRVEPVFRHDSEKNLTTLQFMVSDTGIGIPADQVEALFDPFKQADDSISRKYGGTGLGLSICKKLVELMGGYISVESEENRGSIFRFIIKVEEEAAPTAEENAKDSQNNEISFKSGRILIAEDSPVNRQLLVSMLKKKGLTADTAENGREAVEAVKNNDYQLVFMDMQMPELDGIQATSLIRGELAQKSLPVIALTANVGEEYRKQCLEAGMNDYLAKPVSLHEMQEILLTWLSEDDRQPAV